MGSRGAMKPPPFAYECPTEVAEVVALLAQHGADARPLAGGQSLVPLLNFRLARPTMLVDLNRIATLAHVGVVGGTLRIGAMARQAAVEADSAVARGWPILPAAIGHIAHPQIRNRGTIGGSLALNDPTAELPAVMLALDAEMDAEGPNGARTIAARDFLRRDDGDRAGCGRAAHRNQGAGAPRRHRLELSGNRATTGGFRAGCSFCPVAAGGRRRDRRPRRGHRHRRRTQRAWSQRKRSWPSGGRTTMPVQRRGMPRPAPASRRTIPTRRPGIGSGSWRR